MDFLIRVKNLKELLKEKNLDALLISSHSNITYLTGYSNFSKDEREAYLLISEKVQLLITDGRYAEAVKERVKHFKLLEILPGFGFKEVLEQIKKDQSILKLGFEGEHLNYSEFKKIKRVGFNLKALKLHKIRSIKIPKEIDNIKKACRIGEKAFKFILGKIKEGVSEKELAFELEFFIKKNSDDISFKPIVAFGANSAIPHHQTGSIKLSKNNFVLLDFGVKINGYCSDMTRTLFFGTANKKQKEIYKTVLEAQEKAIKFIESKLKNGKEIKAKDVDKVAREYIKEKGYPNIPHSLGHGVGVEVHEHPRLSPKSKDELKEGMVFSIEPGIYLPNFGGVRIEDLFVIQNNKLKQLTYASKHLEMIS